jgi:uncharacterized FAD-dependent dehydrogenase
MEQIIELKILPEHIEDDVFIEIKLKKKLRTKPHQKLFWKIIRKSVDARKKQAFFLVRIAYRIGEDFQLTESILSTFRSVENAPAIHIIGAGPAGYFTALELIQLGYKPIIIERGKDVRARRRDLKAIQQEGVVNPDSNYCFGEGGAGTYSDGKLYTRSQKRGNIEKVLRLLVEHGAQDDILVDAHPHIGSNKLPKIIQSIRQTIEANGGEIHFSLKLVDILVENGIITSIVLSDGRTITVSNLVLATGHSARDIFYLLDKHGIEIAAKDFALGVRIEHPQPLVDLIQYGQEQREKNLPAASYKLTAQVDNLGVFSFCMCPGGLVVPAATAPGEIVVNGMSLSRRDSPYANSGFVTSISCEELENHGYKGKFKSLDFQKDVEQEIFKNGDGTQAAPAQKLTDFLERKPSSELNPSSYIPGLIAKDLHNILPDFVVTRLINGLKQIGLKIPKFITPDANIIAVESRTSSPIKIPRDRGTCKHPQIENLYPCGEGAGYAGGILSACMDGQRVARAVVDHFSATQKSS